LSDNLSYYIPSGDVILSASVSADYSRGFGPGQNNFNLQQAAFFPISGTDWSDFSPNTKAATDEHLPTGSGTQGWNLNAAGLALLNANLNNTFSLVGRTSADSAQQNLDPAYYELGGSFEIQYLNPILNITYGPPPVIKNPAITNLNQFKSDGITSINEGSSTTGDTVILQATLTNPTNNPVKLQVEVESYATPFTGTTTATSIFSSTWGNLSVSVLNLASGSYHWQARVIDSQGNTSEWQTMSAASVTDFTINNLEPVIIVPGIMGSYLKDRLFNDELWPNFPLMAIPGPDSYLDVLKLDENGNQDKNNPIVTSTDIFRKIDGYDFYQGLIQELENNGYKENRNLFVFPYDWRMNLNSTAGDSQSIWTETLKQKIIDIKKQTGADKVDVVAHSMGGLLVKDYISKYPNNSIDKFIDIATPQLGTPFAFKVLEYGDNLDMRFFLKILGLNLGEAKAISQNMPSIYQLLPSRKYFESGIPGVIANSYILDGGLNSLIPSALDYDQSINYLATTKDKDGSTRNQFLLGYNGINAINVNNQLHDRIDNLPYTDNYYNIIGCGTSTFAGIEKKNGDKYQELTPLNGDGTVPLISANSFGYDSHKYYTNATTHAYIPSTNGVRQLVVSILQGTENNFDFSTYPKLSQNESICGSINGIMVGSQSPVELNVYDENSNHTGPTADGDIEENIPGVTYDILGSDKYAFLPVGHTYHIVNNATSSGELGITIQKIENSQQTQFIYFNGIKLRSASTTVDYNISDNQTQYSAVVDPSGNGTANQTIIPSSILTGNQMNDLTAPVTIINISSKTGNNDYYVSSAKISLAATDDNSGVLKTEYSLDNGNTWIQYSGTLTVSQDGTTTILYYSIDKAGNQEANNKVVIKIDQTKPTISVLLPQENQEIGHDQILTPTYFASDDFSGVATNTAKIYLDNQVITSSTIDLFRQTLGAHKIKISIQGLAGNLASTTVDFSIVTDINGTISDVNRAYNEKMISKDQTRKDLVNALTDIKTFQTKYGSKIAKEQDLKAKAMTLCLKRKNQSWCTARIGTIFDRFEYQLSKINQLLINLKYQAILVVLDLDLKLKVINTAGHDIIKGDIKYLISKL
jgi:hypothetical protein